MKKLALLMLLCCSLVSFTACSSNTVLPTATITIAESPSAIPSETREPQFEKYYENNSSIESFSFWSKKEVSEKIEQDEDDNFVAYIYRYDNSETLRLAADTYVNYLENTFTQIEATDEMHIYTTSHIFDVTYSYIAITWGQDPDTLDYYILTRIPNE